VQDVCIINKDNSSQGEKSSNKCRDNLCTLPLTSVGVYNKQAQCQKAWGTSATPLTKARVWTIRAPLGARAYP
jgi:hypothetical protein